MARSLTQQNLLDNPHFVEKMQELYSLPIEVVAERYSSLTNDLQGDVRFFSSPGRAELVGNHTDHNNGYVIACSVDLDVIGAVTPTDNGVITINSVGYPAFSVDINDLAVRTEEYGTSDAIARGIVKGFLDRGYKVGGFIANTHSRIFKGAGVSSSAGFELLICEILNCLYNDCVIDVDTKAIISQYAENVYFGKPSGLMDQLTISRGGVSFMDFEDTKSPKSATVPCTFDDINLVIVNCGGDHCNLTDEYASIRTEMTAVANYFGKNTLREGNYDDLLHNALDISKKISGRAFLRALHYYNENKRVLAFKESLENNDLNGFVKALNESGLSSYNLLQNCYASGDVDQNIPLALALMGEFKGVLAKRVHGGGFAGTALSVVPKEITNDFCTYMQKVFGKDDVFCLSIRPYGAIEIKL